MRPIKEVKNNNLRRLFYEYDNELPITYKAFAEALEERADVMGKYLAGHLEIPDDKIIKWCNITLKAFTFFYDEHDAVPWPPQKKSYRMMPALERLVLVAEDYVEYNAGTRRIDKIAAFLQVVCKELLHVVPEEELTKNPVLRLFVDYFRAV